MKLIRNIVCFILFLLMMFGIVYLSVPKVREKTNDFISNIIQKDNTKITQTNNQIDFENKTIKVEIKGEKI